MHFYWYIYIYIHISFIGFVHVDPYSSGSTLYNIQVSAVSVQRFFGLKCLEKVPKHTSHSKQQNHQIWSTEKKLNLMQIGWTMIKWQHLPRSLIERTLPGNVDHDDIPALPLYWSTGAVFWDFRGASAKISGCKFLLEFPHVEFKHSRQLNLTQDYCN